MCDHIGWLWNISSRYVCFFIRVHSQYDLQCNARGTRCGLHAHSWSTIWVPNLCIFSSHALLPPLPCHFNEVERQAYTTDSSIFFHQETQSQLNYWQLSVLDMLGILPWLILWSQQFSDSTYAWFSNIEPLHSCRKHMHAMCVQLCPILKCQLHILLVDMGRLLIPVN